MKTKMFLFAIILVVVNSVSAQEKKTLKVGTYHLTQATISAGQGILTTGLDITTSFKNEKNGVLSIQTNGNGTTVSVGKAFGNLRIVESLGIFHNMIWTGPLVTYCLGPLDFMAWNGLVFAKSEALDAPGYKPHFLLSYEGIGITFLRNNRIGGSIMFFGQAPMNWFVSYKRLFNIGSQSKIFVEATYNRNLNAPMFVGGLTVKFN